MQKPKYITKIKDLSHISESERKDIAAVTERYAFRTNSYYNSLIDWNDPDDPIRRISIPSMRELENWGKLDASNESRFTKAPGLEHKYTDTALLLVTDVCGAYCRFCFRKRLFMDFNDEVGRDVSPAIEYIRRHSEINNVLLTGGDPFLLSNRRLESILKQLREIDHVRIIRIGSKMVAFNPHRFLKDSGLSDILKTYSLPDRKIYVMTHFNHPREITPQSRDAIQYLHESNVIMANQTPLLKGINDDPEILAELFENLSFMGVPPYYVFQGRPVSGNKMFSVPIEDGFEIVQKARGIGSGLARRARYAMSHETGKIEILGITEEYTLMKYLRAADPENNGRLLVLHRNPQAYWLDDYDEPEEEYSVFDSDDWWENEINS